MKRQFYKTTIMVEVLSEKPVDFENLSAVDLEITEGDCSGKWEVTKTEELTGEQAVKALLEQGSDPSFFRLTDKGEDIY